MFAKSLADRNPRPFRDRAQAGRLLASRLTAYSNRKDVRVLGLPRGGLPVAFEISNALHLPLDIFLVRKLGVPGHEELAMGAVASGHTRLLQNEILREFQVPPCMVEAATREALQELGRREQVYRSSLSAPIIRGHTIILVDDGLATGSTMRVAVAALKQQQPNRTIVAVPVAAQATYDGLRREVEELVCLETPASFFSVGLWYENFAQVTDHEVRELLLRAERHYAANSLARDANPR